MLPNVFFFARFGGKNGGVLSLRMQVILDSLFARPGSAPNGAGRKESSGTGLMESGFVDDLCPGKCPKSILVNYTFINHSVEAMKVAFINWII